MIDDIALTQKNLITELLNNLPSGYAKSQVSLPNAKFTTPKNKKWLRVTLNSGFKSNVQAGGGYKRTFAIFTIDCFYPVGSGDQAQLQDVRLIQNLYENKQIGNAKCQEAEPLILGGEESWYHAQVNVNLYYEGAWLWQQL